MQGETLQRDHCCTLGSNCTISVIKDVQTRQIHSDRKLPGAGGWSWNRGVTANGHGVSSWGKEHLLELDIGDGCTTCEYAKNHLNCSF